MDSTVERREQNSREGETEFGQTLLDYGVDPNQTLLDYLKAFPVYFEAPLFAKDPAVPASDASPSKSEVMEGRVHQILQGPLKPAALLLEDQLLESRTVMFVQYLEDSFVQPALLPIRLGNLFQVSRPAAQGLSALLTYLNEFSRSTLTSRQSENHAVSVWKSAATVVALAVIFLNALAQSGAPRFRPLSIPEEKISFALPLTPDALLYAAGKPAVVVKTKPPLSMARTQTEREADGIVHLPKHLAEKDGLDGTRLYDIEALPIYSLPRCEGAPSSVVSECDKAEEAARLKKRLEGERVLVAKNLALQLADEHGRALDSLFLTSEGGFFASVLGVYSTKPVVDPPPLLRGASSYLVPLSPFFNITNPHFFSALFSSLIPLEALHRARAQHYGVLFTKSALRTALEKQLGAPFSFLPPPSVASPTKPSPSLSPLTPLSSSPSVSVSTSPAVSVSASPAAFPSASPAASPSASTTDPHSALPGNSPTTRVSGVAPSLIRHVTRRRTGRARDEAEETGGEDEGGEGDEEDEEGQRDQQRRRKRRRISVENPERGLGGNHHRGGGAGGAGGGQSSGGSSFGGAKGSVEGKRSAGSAEEDGGSERAGAQLTEVTEILASYGSEGEAAHTLRCLFPPSSLSPITRVNPTILSTPKTRSCSTSATFSTPSLSASSSPSHAVKAETPQTSPGVQQVLLTPRPKPFLLTLEADPVGTGSSGAVYRARTPSGSALALKLASSNADEEVEAEGRLLALLNAAEPALAPRLVGVYRGGYLRERVVLAMEWGGERVRSMVELSKEDRGKIYSLFLTLHSLGYVHGDPRLANILRDKPTKAFKLIDFGRSSRHDCKGEKECEELKEVKEWLEV